MLMVFDSYASNVCDEYESKPQLRATTTNTEPTELWGLPFVKHVYITCDLGIFTTDACIR